MNKFELTKTIEEAKTSYFDQVVYLRFKNLIETSYNDGDIDWNTSSILQSKISMYLTGNSNTGEVVYGVEDLVGFMAQTGMPEGERFGYALLGDKKFRNVEALDILLNVCKELYCIDVTPTQIQDSMCRTMKKLHPYIINNLLGYSVLFTEARFNELLKILVRKNYLRANQIIEIKRSVTIIID